MTMRRRQPETAKVSQCHCNLSTTSFRLLPNVHFTRLLVTHIINIWIKSTLNNSGALQFNESQIERVQFTEKMCSPNGHAVCERSMDVTVLHSHKVPYSPSLSNCLHSDSIVANTAYYHIFVYVQKIAAGRPPHVKPINWKHKREARPVQSTLPHDELV